MGLKFVDPAIDAGENLTSNFLIYGPPGTRKTSGAGTAPGPILFLNAEGANRARFARRLWGDKLREVEVTGKDVLRDTMLAVKSDPSAFRTVVLDTAGEVYRVLTDEAAGESGMPQVQHYGDAGKTLERFCRFMRDQPVNLVVLSHEELTDGPDGALLMPGGFGNKLPPKLCGMVDYVGYAGVMTPKDGEDGPARSVVQFAQGRGRYAKNSEGALDAVSDFDISEWLDSIRDADAPKPASKKTTKAGR